MCVDSGRPFIRRGGPLNTPTTTITNATMSSNDSKKDDSKKDDSKKDDGKKGYESPIHEDPKGAIKKCDKCNCWTDDREHKCEPADKNKYA
ncbi:hypothetical protein M426DRAFT_16961 [Hypoxylon sp. CI-4A]|nr:hypothetical protein M426DRAFT_16961 [Hypoxylon sp. CI-4A]